MSGVVLVLINAAKLRRLMWGTLMGISCSCGSKRATGQWGARAAKGGLFKPDTRDGAFISGAVSEHV